ncbi:hypothetical protein [Streptosporangium canum]|uniref:hypothetical protein n=1 Tax=Streptosporangium canum TaxID=324952 RepID=UPI003794AA34
MRVLIAGGGIGGRTAVLGRHAAGIECVVAESAVELRPPGAGIDLRPHAAGKLAGLGPGDGLAEIGVRTGFQTRIGRSGGTILGLPRGRTSRSAGSR